MKRYAGWILIALALAAMPLTRAQKEARPGQTEAGSQTGHREGEPPSESQTGAQALWRFANFVLLVGGLGYIAYKQIGPYYASRNLALRKGLIEADEIRSEAEARVSAVDRKLAGLEAEIAALKDEALAEERNENERFRSETVAELAKIHAHAREEMEAAGKAARLELRRHAAAVALRLAEQRIRAGMTPATQEVLVRQFVEHLAQPASQAQTT